MIELDTQAEQDRALAAITNWESSTSGVRHILKIGGEDFSDSIPEGSLKQDGIAVTLEAKFAGPLPLRLYGAPVDLSVTFNGVEVPRLKGSVSLQEENDDRISTKLDAASTGALADKYPLNERVEYVDAPPYFIVRDAYRRLPYPDPGGVRVDNVAGPSLTFARGSSAGGAAGDFNRNQKVSDIFSAVANVVPYLFRDNSRGGSRAFVSLGLATAGNLDMPDHMRFHAEDILFWKSPALALEQYAAVVADKLDQSGESLFGDNPPTANVIYRNRDFQPPAGLILRVEWNGTSAEGQQFVYDKAEELARGLYKSVPILPYNPLAETGDAFTVTEHKEEEPGAGYFEREWLHYIDSWEEPWAAGFSTKPACSATLANEQFVRAPTLILGLITGGNNRPIWGWDSGHAPYFDDALPWIGLDETGAWIDPGLAQGLAEHDETGFLVDV